MKPTATMRAAMTVLLLLATMYAWSSMVHAAELRGGIRVSEAWARLPPEGSDATTAYMQIVNFAENDDRLVAASSPWADEVVIARQDIKGYGLRFRTVDSVSIRSNGKVTLKPGGYQLRLAALKQDLRPGMAIPITLRFEKAGAIDAAAAVTNRLLGLRRPGQTRDFD